MEQKLSSAVPPTDPDFFNTYTATQNRLENLMTEWETLQTELDSLAQ